jgi:predicted PurR-regulated permease PerM
MKALYLGVFVLVLQQVDGDIIGPGILGETTGLSSFWVLFSILLFGGLWGVVGMVIGVPLFAVIYSMVGTWANNRLQKKNLSTQTTSYLDMDPAGLDEGSYLE